MESLTFPQKYVFDDSPLSLQIDKHSGTTGSQTVCCNSDGCNWSLDTATTNTAYPFTATSDLLSAALPYIVAGLLVLGILLVLCVVCCSATACSACGCLCCGAGKKYKKKKRPRYE